MRYLLCKSLSQRERRARASGPGEGYHKYSSLFFILYPSPAASRHPLPSGEGFISVKYGLLCMRKRIHCNRNESIGMFAEIQRNLPLRRFHTFRSFKMCSCEHIVALIQTVFGEPIRNPHDAYLRFIYPGVEFDIRRIQLPDIRCNTKPAGRRVNDFGNAPVLCQRSMIKPINVAR